MGHFAELFAHTTLARRAARFGCVLSETASPQDPPPPARHYVIISSQLPAAEDLAALVAIAPCTLALDAAEGPPAAAGCQVVLLRPKRRALPPAVRALVRAPQVRVVLWEGVYGSRLGLFVALHRAGLSQVLARESLRWRCYHLRRIALAKVVDRLYGIGVGAVERSVSALGLLVSRVSVGIPLLRKANAGLGRLGLSPVDTRQWSLRFEQLARRARPAVIATRPRITLYLGSLDSGGAERQHVNLAIGLHERGYPVRVFTSVPLSGHYAHYRPLLARHGVAVAQAGLTRRSEVERLMSRFDATPQLIRSFPYAVRITALDLAGELLADPPDILHCTLDHTNIAGALAGLLVGVPHILLSTRNANPSNFFFYRHWMHAYYSFLADRPEVRFIANSSNGARDYAHWIGIAADRFRVILNGLQAEAMPEVGAGPLEILRRELGLKPGDRVVAGIFRLSWEKRPLTFLDIVARVAQRCPSARFIHAGIGPLESKLRRAIRRRGLHERVHLLGQRDDVAALLHVADVLVLPSIMEGTPNVVLEAQWSRRPVVATAVGGTPDIVRDGETGFLHTVQDVEGMADSTLRLLNDAELRERMGAAGHELVGERFTMNRMVEETITLYQESLAARAPTPRAAERTAPSPEH